MIHPFEFIYICLNGNWRFQPPHTAVPAVAWTHAQVVNSNSTSAVQDPCSGGELKLHLNCTGSTLRWWTQTLPRLYRIQAQVGNSNSTSAVQDPHSGGELKLYLGLTVSTLRWWTLLRYQSNVDIFYRIELIPVCDLSSKRTNYNNDIHKFLQQFEWSRVNRDSN